VTKALVCHLGMWDMNPPVRRIVVTEWIWMAMPPTLREARGTNRCTPKMHHVPREVPWYNGH